MDYKSMMTDLAKIQGRENLYPYAIGIIDGILGDLSTTAENKVIEIALALKSMDIVMDTESLPWDLADTKKASAPTEATEQYLQQDCNMDTTKIEPLMSFPLIELGPDCKDCLCFKCKFLRDCHLELPSTVYHCHNECKGSAAKRICNYHVERCLV
ncbi:hypothetical protein DEAC_c40420 [Desulfosporosinus acididurans]|uniref:Uncharacterized protein n=1 Tax=Desulfosporosinus acididurans TaxID=476652 RepID=A0A0J1FM71_9FIRM|nr:hypothetical protein [Desulfosporosinus acididurans]KLU64048.1 hypothetical protein DEAC_c40420 [Desulfosporosinus acididurans]